MAILRMSLRYLLILIFFKAKGLIGKNMKKPSVFINFGKK